MKSLLNQGPQLSQKKLEEHQKQHEKLKKLLQKSKGMPIEHVLKTKNQIQMKVSSRLPPVAGNSKRNSVEEQAALLDNAVFAVG